MPFDLQAPEAHFSLLLTTPTKVKTERACQEVEILKIINLKRHSDEGARLPARQVALRKPVRRGDVIISAFPITRLLPRRRAGFSRGKRDQSDGVF